MMEKCGSCLLLMCTLYLRDGALAEDAIKDIFLITCQNLIVFRWEASGS